MRLVRGSVFASPHFATNATWARILQDGNAKWEELSLEDICTVLEIYGVTR